MGAALRRGARRRRRLLRRRRGAGGPPAGRLRLVGPRAPRRPRSASTAGSIRRPTPRFPPVLLDLQPAGRRRPPRHGQVPVKSALVRPRSDAAGVTVTPTGGVGRRGRTEPAGAQAGEQAQAAPSRPSQTARPAGAPAAADGKSRRPAPAGLRSALDDQGRRRRSPCGAARRRSGTVTIAAIPDRPPPSSPLGEPQADCRRRADAHLRDARTTTASSPPRRASASPCATASRSRTRRPPLVPRRPCPADAARRRQPRGRGPHHGRPVRRTPGPAPASR